MRVSLIATFVAALGLMTEFSSARSYGSYYGNNGSSTSVTYRGTALKETSPGVYAWVPVTECEFGCAVNGVCGTEGACKTAQIVGIIVGSVFGFIFLMCCCCFCCFACKTGSQVAKSVS